jgi:hypothetical protein
LEEVACTNDGGVCLSHSTGDLGPEQVVGTLGDCVGVRKGAQEGALETA